MEKQPFENVVHYLFQIAAQAEFKNLNDQQLLKKYLEHQNELAFGELVRRYRQLIWYVCWNVLRHHQDVEDAFQATVMTFIRRAKTLLGRETIEGWLHQTAFKMANAAKRSRARRRAREAGNPTMQQESFKSDKWNLDLGEMIDKELIRIPEKFRNPLILCYLQGHTQKQAAEKLSISVDNLQWRLHVGRKRLGRKLSKHRREFGTAMSLPLANLIQRAHIPEVPHDLVERTLDAVRMMTLSGGSLGTAGISPQVAMLVKSALGMTPKLKLLLGSSLLSLVVITAGVAKFTGILHVPLGAQRQEKKLATEDNSPEKHRSENVLPHTDRHGDPLPPGALDRLGTVRYRHHGEGLGNLVVTPHKINPLIVHDGGRQLWDFTTGKPLYQVYDAHGEAIPIASRSPGTGWILSIDGRLLAKHDKIDDVYRFWDMATYQPLNLRLKTVPQSMAISPDGETVAVRSHDGYLRGWDSSTGSQKWEYKEQNHYRDSDLVYSSDGNVLMCLRKEEKVLPNNQGILVAKTMVCRWETAAGKKLEPWIIANKDISHYAWSRDGGMLAVLPEWEGKIIQLWSMDTGEQVRRIHVEGKNVQPGIRLALSPDGKMMATGAYYQDDKGKICLWDTVTGQWLRDCANQGNWPDKLIFSHDGTKLVATSVNKPTIEIYDTDSGKQLNQEWLERGYCTKVDSVAFSSHSKTLASTAGGQFYSRLYLWDTSAQGGLHPFHSVIPDCDPDSHDYFSVALAPNGKTAASYAFVGEKNGNANVVRLWDVASGRELRNHRVPEVAVVLSFSPNSDFLAGTLEGNRTVVWDVASGKQLPCTLNGITMAFFPDGKKLVTNTEKGLHIWETATGKELDFLPKKAFNDIEKVAISSDGQMLAAIGNMPDAMAANGKRPTIYIWEIDTSNNSFHMRRPRRLINLDHIDGSTLAFSPDRRLLATSNSSHSVIHVWEIATGQERCHFNDDNQGNLTSCPPSFSSDCRRLATGHTDTTLLIWDLTGRVDGDRLIPSWLSIEEMEARWKDLASVEAARAARALWSLIAAGSPTVSFLQAHLRPSQRKSVTAETLTKLIADLEHTHFTVRKEASVKLQQLGEVAEASLRQALDNKASLELRHSIEQLLKTVDEARSLVMCSSPDVLRSLRAIEVLEQIGSPEAQQLLEKLSHGAPGVVQTLEAQAALRRLRKVAGPS